MAFDINNVNGLVRIIGFLFLIVFGTKLLSITITKILKKFAALTPTKKDDEVIEEIENPIVYIVTLLVVRFSLYLVGFWPSAISVTQTIIDSLVIIFVAKILIVFVYLAINLWKTQLEKRKLNFLDDQIVGLLDRTVHIIMYAIAFGYILTVWKIDIWPVLGSLGVAGIAIAFALQETLKNLFGGIQIITDKIFSKGDIIQLSSGESGTIFDITLRSTRIKTWDNKLIIIPNAIMANDIVMNISKPDRSRRVEIKFGIEYGNDPEYVKAIVLNEIETVKEVELINPAPVVVFKEMGESALIFEAKFWVMDLSNFISAKEDATIKIYERLNAEGIGIPFPQMTVWTNNNGNSKPFKYVKKDFKSSKFKRKSLKKSD